MKGGTQSHGHDTMREMTARYQALRGTRDILPEEVAAWRFLEAQFGSAYSDGPGCPPLPTRLMAGLALLKHMHDLSDEALCDRWVENPYFQFFCGEEFFQHRLAFDRSSLTRWRQRMGEERLAALLQESLAVATRTEAM